MKKGFWKKAVALCAVAGLAAFALAGCAGGSDNASSASDSSSAQAENDNVIVIGASPSPHAAILEVVKEQLANEGYTLDIKEYNDYVLPNTAVSDGDLDANYFQHITYLNDFNEKNGTNLVNVADVHYEPLGVYTYEGKYATLEELPDGATVAVPNDPTNEARALLLLQDQGLITLKEGAGLDATQIDIVENPKNLEFVEIEAAQAVNSLPDVDIAVINGNYALSSGLKIEDALVTENATDELKDAYKNVVVVNAGNENSAKIQALVNAIQSDAVKEYIENTYTAGDKQAVIAVF